MDTGLDSLKTACKTLVHKTGKFFGSKIADARANLHNGKTVKQELVDEIIIPLEKREELLNELRKILI